MKINKYKRAQGAPNYILKYKNIKIKRNKLNLVIGDFIIPLSEADKSSRDVQRYWRLEQYN